MREEGLLPKRLIRFYGECSQFEEYVRMKEFFSKSGYDELRRRMCEEIAGRKKNVGNYDA